MLSLCSEVDVMTKSSCTWIELVRLRIVNNFELWEHRRGYRVVIQACELVDTVCKSACAFSQDTQVSIHVLEGPCFHGMLLVQSTVSNDVFRSQKISLEGFGFGEQLEYVSVRPGSIVSKFSLLRPWQRLILP